MDNCPSIIFDLDGTLWDTSEITLKIWENIAQEYNIEIKENDIKNIMGLTIKEIVEYLFKNNTKNGYRFISECQKEENKYFEQHGGKIYKNTIYTIKELSKKTKIFIVSNCQKGYIEAFLKHYNLERYISDFECSGNTGKEKTDNTKIIIKRNNVSNALLVGDTEKDYRAAVENNIKFIWASYGFGVCNSYYKKIDDIYDILKIINDNVF